MNILLLLLACYCDPGGSSAATDHRPVDQVDITCEGGHVNKLVYNYAHSSNVKPSLRPLEYEVHETIYGILSHDVRVIGDEDCYELVIRLR